MVSFQLATLAHNLFIYFLGFAVFLLELRLLYALRYNKWISTLGSTLSNSVGTLASVGVWFALFFVACTCFFNLMFGPDVKEYNSLYNTASTIVVMAVSFRGFDRFPAATGQLGGIVLLIYAMVSIVIFINFFLTIFNQFLHEVKVDKKLHRDGEVIDHLLSILKTMFQTADKKGEHIKSKESTVFIQINDDHM